MRTSDLETAIQGALGKFSIGIGELVHAAL
jgi:hypothetical protein